MWSLVGCILEAWLANKGFAVGPSASATGMPRETREQRQLRRLAQLEQRQREEAAALQRALQRQLQVEQMQHRRVREAERMGIHFDPEEEEQVGFILSYSTLLTHNLCTGRINGFLSKLNKSHSPAFR